MSDLIDQETGEKYKKHFQEDVYNRIKDRPIELRKSKDIFGTILFIGILGSFIGFSIYFLISGATNISKLSFLSTVQKDKQNFSATLVKNSPVIIGMIALSIANSVLFFFLCLKFPHFMAVFGIAICFIVYIGIIVFSAMTDVYALTATVSAVLVLNALILYVRRNQLINGIVLMKISTIFLKQRPKILIIGFVSLLLNLLFQALYICGQLAAYSRTLKQYEFDQGERSKFGMMMKAHHSFFIVISFFLYYLMVFAVATYVSYWFYQEEKNIFYGYKLVLKNIGSLTYASILITIVKALTSTLKQQINQQNKCLAVVYCILTFLISCIRAILEALNHHAIIVMTITNQNFLNSAKSSLALIFQNLGPFVLLRFVSNFMDYYSVAICALMPSLLGAGIIYALQFSKQSALIGGGIIFFLSWMVSSVLFGVYSQIMTSLFILYCLDRKFRLQENYKGNLPVSIKQLIEQSSKKIDQKIAKSKEKEKRKTKQQKQEGGTSMKIKQSDNIQVEAEIPYIQTFPKIVIKQQRYILKNKQSS